METTRIGDDSDWRGLGLETTQIEDDSDWRRLRLEPNRPSNQPPTGWAGPEQVPGPSRWVGPTAGRRRGARTGADGPNRRSGPRRLGLEPAGPVGPPTWPGPLPVRTRTGKRRGRALGSKTRRRTASVSQLTGLSLPPDRPPTGGRSHRGARRPAAGSARMHVRARAYTHTSALLSSRKGRCSARGSLRPALRARSGRLRPARSGRLAQADSGSSGRLAQACACQAVGLKQPALPRLLSLTSARPPARPPARTHARTRASARADSEGPPR